MSDYDVWLTTPPDGLLDEPEACEYCGSTGPKCAEDCVTQETEARGGRS